MVKLVLFPIRCEACGRDDVKYRLTVVEETEVCERCGSVREREHDFCSLECMLAFLAETRGEEYRRVLALLRGGEEAG